MITRHRRLRSTSGNRHFPPRYLPDRVSARLCNGKFWGNLQSRRQAPPVLGTPPRSVSAKNASCSTHAGLHGGIDRLVASNKSSVVRWILQPPNGATLSPWNGQKDRCTKRESGARATEGHLQLATRTHTHATGCPLIKGMTKRKYCFKEINY